MRLTIASIAVKMYIQQIKLERAMAIAQKGFTAAAGKGGELVT